MNKQELQNKVNAVVDAGNALVDYVKKNVPTDEDSTPAAVATDRALPKGQRAVRTKSSGDRVYLLDDNKKTRHWVTNPEVLKAAGFELTDVVDVDDDEMAKYQMGAALYRVENE